MRSFILVAVLVVAVTMALMADARHLNQQEWLAYKEKYGKFYETPEEDAHRFALFLRSKARLATHSDDESHTRGLNHMSDWSHSNAKQLRGFAPAMRNAISLKSHTRNTPEAEQFLADILADDSKPVPDELDWRKVPGRVSAVKDQGSCSSGWTFATTGLLEGQQVIHGNNKTLVPLSEQFLIDCVFPYSGCAFGGSTDWALMGIGALGGIQGEQDYPYTARGETCKFDKSKNVMTAAGPVFLRQKDEENLKQVVAKYGPVSVWIDSSGLIDYKQGVYMGDRCQKAWATNHSVLIVGYGTDPKQGDFWIVKNSWGDKWGEKGYFRISRGKNTCNIGLNMIIAKL